MLFHLSLCFGIPVRGHSAHRKDIVVGRPAIGGKQADHHDRVGEDFHGGVKGLSLGFLRFVLLGGCLKNRFQIDRHRVIAGRNHVLLMHVSGREAVEERKPSAGPPEKSLAAFLIGASRMVNELGPTVTVPRNRAHRLQFEWRPGPVQSLDQGVPGNIEPQILRLVHDPRAVLEADDLDRMAAIVRIGKIAFDFGNPAVGAGNEGYRDGSSPDRHQGAGRIRATYRSTAA